MDSVPHSVGNAIELFRVNIAARHSWRGREVIRTDCARISLISTHIHSESVLMEERGNKENAEGWEMSWKM